MESGFYWVHILDRYHDEWVVAEHYLNKWNLPGTDEVFVSSEFAEIGERIPDHG